MEFKIKQEEEEDRPEFRARSVAKFDEVVGAERYLPPAHVSPSLPLRSCCLESKISYSRAAVVE